MPSPQKAHLERIAQQQGMHRRGAGIGWFYLGYRPEGPPAAFQRLRQWFRVIFREKSHG
jgi:hypothetical protein